MTPTSNFFADKTLLLRGALAFAFLYPPLDSITNSEAWITYFPAFMLSHFPTGPLLLAWGILEVIIALWILSGKKIFIPSVLAALLLCSIVFFNIPLIEVVFRDLSLALVAATLAWWNYKKA